jgi:hypothetical protein
VVGCGGEAVTDDGVATRGDELAVSDGNAAALGSEASCDALLGRLQAHLLAQVSERAEQARTGAGVYYGGGVFIDDVAPSFVGAAPQLSVAAPSAGSSVTTSQSPGVEDGDFVKVAGDHIYLLNGTTLFILDARQESATAILAEVPLEGDAVDLHVQAGKVAVLTRIYGPVTGIDDVYSPYYYYYPSYTKLTVVDVADGAPEVVRESYFEGDGYQSRRDGSIVRALIQQSSKAQLDYPSISYVDVFGRPRSQAEIDLQVDLWALLATESIEDSTIENYLPAAYERIDGALVQQPFDCAGYLVPSGDPTRVGSTSIVSVDLEAPGEVDTLTLLGYADYLHIGQDALILAQTDYGDGTSPVPQTRVSLHLFELEGTVASYAASGFLAGYIPAQLALDLDEGVVRAVTSEERYETTDDGNVVAVTYLGTSNQVVTLEAQGGALVELGRSPSIAPGQSITGVRFAGDRAYVAAVAEQTQVAVLDLSDPSAPSLGGQASATGYINSFIPLPGERLLAAGTSYDPFDGSQQVELQLFDVGDVAAPSLDHSYAFGPNVYTDAAYDIRAITFHPSRDILSLPIQDGFTGAGSLEVLSFSAESGFAHLGSVAPPPPDYSLEECLVLLGYGYDPAFIEQVQSDPVFQESIMSQCNQYYGSYVRRGLFRDDVVFAIATQGVSAHALDALEGPPLGAITLPPPGYYPVPIPVPEPLPPPPEEAPEAASGEALDPAPEGE